MRILIDNGTLVTLDQQRRIIKNGAVAVDGDKITAVGKSQAVRASFQADKTINATGHIVMPGLINGHMHFVQNLARGVADDVDDLFGWLYDRVLPFEAALSEEDAFISALHACAEMVRSGTTCFADPGGFREDIGARAIEESGLRGIIAWRGVDTIVDSSRPMPGATIATAEENISRNTELFKKFHGTADGRIRVWFGVGDPRAGSVELLRGVKKKAAELGTGIEIHVAPTEQATEYLKRRKGMADIEYLDSVGFLGPEVLVVHAGWITDKGVELIARNDVKTCHCPGASLHGAYGSCSRGKFPELLKKRATVCLGVDASAENNSLDMFRALYQAATCHNEARLARNVITPEKALEMATVDGARALGMEHQTGSIEAGKKADVIVVNAGKLNLLPLFDFNLVPNLVYSGDGADVETVLVDGRVLMENRRLTTIDEARLARQVQEAGERVMERAGLKLKAKWPVL